MRFDFSVRNGDGQLNIFSSAGEDDKRIFGGLKRLFGNVKDFPRKIFKSSFGKLLI